MVLSAEIVDGKLHMVVMLHEQVPSKSGKMNLIASTRGYQSLPVIVEGLPVSVSLNVGVPGNPGNATATKKGKS